MKDNPRTETDADKETDGAAGERGSGGAPPTPSETPCVPVRPGSGHLSIAVMNKGLCIGIAIAVGLTLICVICIIKFATTVEENRVQMNRLSFSGAPDVVKISRRTMNNSVLEAALRYPFLAAITSRKVNDTIWNLKCFGSVILPNWVVTAAHCITTDPDHRVYLYYDFIRNESRTFPVVKWVVHEEYDPSIAMPWHDVALGKTDGEMRGLHYTKDFITSNVSQPQAMIWKTLMTMDHRVYLTDDADVYDVQIAPMSNCYELYGGKEEERLICVDLSMHSDCFVTEFGPIFTPHQKLVGLLQTKPKDCDHKYAVFTNMTWYYNWILNFTGTTVKRL